MIYRTILVDDDSKSLDSLIGIIKGFIPKLHIVATYSNPLQVIKEFNDLKPDLVITDIEMPEMSGLDMVKHLKLLDNSTYVFVTGYNKYAIEALKLGAFDYIVKPITIELLMELIDRLIIEKKLNSSEFSIRHNNMLAVNRHDRCYFIRIDDINYIIAGGPYSTIVLQNNEKIINSKPLKYYEDLLLNDNFIRPHRSIIINVQNIKELHRLVDEEAKLMFRDGSAMNISSELRNQLINHVKRQ
ncbi:MAG: response regulator transcription factor [Bacteroidetes bacterium]|nr:response regulator transcription factor [Bacteroidota bacterium]